MNCSLFRGIRYGYLKQIFKYVWGGRKEYPTLKWFMSDTINSLKFWE